MRVSPPPPSFGMPTKSGLDVTLAVLKKPLHTSIAVEMDEFDDIEVADKLHIIISVRDFRAILQHANWTSGNLNAAYSRPGRPMKIHYGHDGIMCEFVLMTVDEKSTTVQKKGQGKAATKASRPSLNAAPNTSSAGANNDSRQPTPAPPREQQEQQARMPPPARRSTAPRSSQFDIRAPLVQPQSTLKSESLFLPQPDDDEMWAPVNPDDEEEGENPRLEWDASNEPVSVPEYIGALIINCFSESIDHADQRPLREHTEQPAEQFWGAFATVRGTDAKGVRSPQVWPLYRLVRHTWLGQASGCVGLLRAWESWLYGDWPDVGGTLSVDKTLKVGLES